MDVVEPQRNDLARPEAVGRHKEVFFADAGNVDPFAFSILTGAVRRPDIFAWNHENDSRSWVAPSLERYLEWRLSGRIAL